MQRSGQGFMWVDVRVRVPVHMRVRLCVFAVTLDLQSPKSMGLRSAYVEIT